MRGTSQLGKIVVPSSTLSGSEGRSLKSENYMDIRLGLF